MLGKRLYNYKKSFLIALPIILLLSLALFFSSAINLTIGNIFFGSIPKLYNAKLAHFFFTHAAYPLLGKEETWTHYQLSRSYFIQGDLSKSLTEAKKELELYPDNKRTYYILGLTYGYLNKEKEAIEAFEKFIEWNPGTWAARNDKAWLEFRIGDIDSALTTIEPIAWMVDNPWVQNTYGTLLINKKRYDEAKKALENAKRVTDTMTEKIWGNSYPGNDPRIYDTGLSAMRISIENNIKILEKK